MAVMAATEISEAISTYSIAVAPRSFFINLRKMDNIFISKRIAFNISDTGISARRLCSGPRGGRDGSSHSYNCYTNHGRSTGKDPPLVALHAAVKRVSNRVTIV